MFCAGDKAIKLDKALACPWKRDSHFPLRGGERYSFSQSFVPWAHEQRFLMTLAPKGSSVLTGSLSLSPALWHVKLVGSKLGLIPRPCCASQL